MRDKGPAGSDRGFHGDNAPVPEVSMANAATYEQLIACWGTLMTRLNSSAPPETTQRDPLKQCLGRAYQCFRGERFACDTAVKDIFSKDDFLKQLSELGIPENFLLQTVRVGALKSALKETEDAPHSHVILVPDGRVKEGFPPGETNLDGFSWANEQLRLLGVQKKEAAKMAQAREREQIKGNKEAAIARIQGQMREPGFHLEAQDVALLKEDFLDKFRAWKSFISADDSRGVYNFLKEHKDKEMTPAFFEQLKANIASDSRMQGKALSPSLDIIDPASGWFAALIVTQATSVSRLIGYLEIEDIQSNLEKL